MPKESQRSLSPIMCTALVIGNMVGSGIFLLPSALAVFGGISLFGWIFTAVGAGLFALLFARLSRKIPKAGGPYAYTREAFGDFAGFLVAWGYWISILAGNAAIAIAFSGYLGVFFPTVSSSPLLSAVVALAAIWLLTWVNNRGVREAGIMQVITTIMKLLPLLIIPLFGLFVFKWDHFQPFNQSAMSNFSAVTAAAAITLFAFLGLESATIPADHIRNPEKTIPRSTLLGTLITALVYIFSTVTLMGIIHPTILTNSKAPFADAAVALWGPWAGYAVAAGAAVSCLGALNGWILLQGQVPKDTARDRLFPPMFAHLSLRNTPTMGLLISSILVTILIAFNFTKALVELYTFAILLSTLTCLLPYAFCAMAYVLIMIRGRSLRQKGVARPVLIGVLGFLYSLWAIAGSGRDTVFWGFLLILAGIPVYVFVQWKHASA